MCLLIYHSLWAVAVNGGCGAGDDDDSVVQFVTRNNNNNIIAMDPT